MVHALITGGGGLVGRALCKTLLDADWQVTSFSRRPSETLREMGVGSILGSITDPAAVQEAVSGKSVVFHMAAETSDRASFQAVNVVGTQNVVQACRDHQVGHLVYTSTTAALDAEGFLHDGVNEQAVRERLHAIDGSHKGLSPYGASKAMGQYIVSSARSQDLRAVCLVVPQVVSPDNKRLTDFLGKTAGSIVPEPGDHKFDWIGVHDVAEAHFRAAGALLAGQATEDFYIVTSARPQPYIGFINGLLAALGLPPMVLTSEEDASRRLSPGVLKKMKEPRWYDTNASRRDLKCTPRQTFEGVCGEFKDYFFASTSRRDPP